MGESELVAKLDELIAITRAASTRANAQWLDAAAARATVRVRRPRIRHEATTRLARKLDVLDLSRMTGHRDLKSLRRYYNPTATEIAARLG